MLKFYASSFLGLLGGSNAELQNTFLKIEFQDASGAKLLETVLHGPQVEEVNLAEGLLLRTSTGFLPPNVRRAKVTLDLHNSYAADNVSLTLTTDPLFGVNLLENGDAETAPKSNYDPDSDLYLPVTGWNARSSFAQWAWGGY